MNCLNFVRWILLLVVVHSGGLWLALPGPVERCRAGSLFTIDPARSSVTVQLLGDIGGPTMPLAVPQAPGSDQTSLSGTLDLDFSNPAYILLTQNSSLLPLTNSGDFQPFGGPAQLAMQFSDFPQQSDISYVAFRNVEYRVVGDFAWPPPPGGNELSASVRFEFSAGQVDLDVPGFANSESLDLAAFGQARLSYTTAHWEQDGRLTTLTWPISLLYPSILLPFQVHVEGIVTATYVEPSITGDANGDCMVGAADYAIWAAQFGQSTGPLLADFDGNGSVGAGDYALWAATFGNTCAPTGTPVPEPNSIVLVFSAAATIGWFLCRRRRNAA